MEIKPAIRTSVAEVHGDDGDGADVNLKKNFRPIRIHATNLHR